VAQDPEDAAYPGMPQTALDAAEVDFCVPIAAMGGLLVSLVGKRAGKSPSVPADVRTEAAIAERVLSDIEQVNGLGDLVPYNCRNCGGVLWEMKAQTDRGLHRAYSRHVAGAGIPS
jgi:two-component system chemotaxis response regulator CheB